MDLKDKVAIVTGSARGIGLTIAERFAKLGARVVVCDVDETAVEQATGRFSTPVLGLKTDVTSSADVAAMVESTQKEFGRIDIVVNNAGITRDTLMIRMDEKDWELVLDINLKGAFLVIKATCRVMMKQRSGRIVNISSVVGLTGNAGQSNYSASKAGLIGLTKSAAKELGGRNITVNAVAPGFIETEMTRNLPDATREGFMSRVLINRLGTPDDVASAVMFLASDEAAYITGQVLTVDGGLTV